MVVHFPLSRITPDRFCLVAIFRTRPQNLTLRLIEGTQAVLTDQHSDNAKNSCYTRQEHERDCLWRVAHQLSCICCSRFPFLTPFLIVLSRARRHKEARLRMIPILCLLLRDMAFDARLRAASPCCCRTTCSAKSVLPSPPQHRSSWQQ